MRRCFRGVVCTCTVLVLCCVELEIVDADKVLFFEPSVHVIQSEEGPCESDGGSNHELALALVRK